MSFNRIFLLGNLGKDPELRYTPQQTAVCSFSLATSERRKDASGNWSDHTEWHNIIVFGRVAENCNSYLKKGRQAFIEGRIQTRKWQDKEGRDRYTTEVIASTVQFVGGRGQGADAGGQDFHGAGSSGGDEFGAPPSGDVFSSFQTADSLASSGTGQGRPSPGSAGGGKSGSDISFDDDDIPF